MVKVFLFMMISLDGYFEGPNHDISWHNVDKEFNEFAANMMNDTGAILFGRRTYELMASYWPTAKPTDSNDAMIAQKMNNLPKVVFSRTLKSVHEEANWKNIKLVKSNIAEEVQKLKRQGGKNIAVLASSNLCATLIKLNLLDEIRVMINPIVLGEGTPLFKGLDKRLALKLTKTSDFVSGNSLLYYGVVT
jgi:dihydrofolate reductase